MELTIPLFSLILPFLLWPIEFFLPISFLIEEFAKFIMVIYILKNVEDDDMKIKLAIFSGVFFALSETVIYIFNIQLVGSLQTLLIRLALTIPLHVLTYLLILIPGMKNTKYAILGLIAALILHYLFNSIIEYSFYF